MEHKIKKIKVCLQQVIQIDCLKSYHNKFKYKPKSILKKNISLLFVTPTLLFVTPPSKESNTSKQEISETVESLEMGEVVRGVLDKEDVDMDLVETGDRHS